MAVVADIAEMVATIPESALGPYLWEVLAAVGLAVAAAADLAVDPVIGADLAVAVDLTAVELVVAGNPSIDNPRIF